LRGDAFTFKCNADERRMIVILAERLQRKQSDAVRFVIRESVKALQETPTDAPRSVQANTQQEQVTA
jgi:hypothetical protein